ncbi:MULTISPECIES: SLAP domain-containing protein [Brevibacillus]|jgi:SLAP domain-containing protein|uniref:SLAP domain-containing protein n=1 Tax=Brevibacillus parabrevis TaxID=54914 RepID=A0A4Y3PA44_BREPA|nr:MULTISPECIES: SLAP domain-containing protein [Brevibacillus]TGV29423.1 SLAP domain-containing protein [Mesorhizobium sp. M00.F.Ca.ET.186.01.1.1]MBU8713651.1 SLAP domain-containing protein [Brevibacillus parabrevis]MDH6350899.1 SLAP domain-containing protein [Brevibacillus sp. 1238]MDR4997852.1 SLAP domain-containing protein [Brevibacillus parabrevis]MED1722432.1 SLAP domain-containing protein [Brevibacillus parabrevis]
MFSFMKNLFGKEQGEKALDELKKEIQEESAFDIDELKETEVEVEKEQAKTSAPAKREKIKTELSLHPLWEQELDSEKKYTLRFLQEELPEIARGLISVTGFSMIPQPNGMIVTMFFRNATDKPVRFKTIGLAIYLDDKPFARIRIDLSEMGSIPPHTSRPWEVLFPEESYLHDNFQFSRWKVVMKAGNRAHIWPRTLELDPEMENRMTDRQKDRLEKLANSLPPIPVNTVQVTGFDIGKTKEGQLVAAMLFRNGLSTEYRPEQLKVTISDTDGDVVARGVLDARKICVQPGNSRPWLIVFPPEFVKKPDANLRRWILDVE